MKLQSSKSQLNRIVLNSKIFQTITIPGNNKGISQIQKYLSNLKNSVKLLDQSKSKNKTNIKNTFHPSRSVLIKNKKEEKGSYNYNTHKTIRDEIINEENKANNKSKIKSLLYSDKLSLLKEKNKKILNKMLSNRNKFSSINKSEEKNNKSNKNETFVTSFDFPKVKEKNNESIAVMTEFEEKNSKIKSRNKIYSLPRIDYSKSSREGNTIEIPNSRTRIKSHIIKTNNSFNIKLANKTKDINPINKLYNNKPKEKENIPNLNKKLISLFGYDFKHSTPSSPVIANFIKGVKNLKKKLNKKNVEYELDKWVMRSKLKYARWKFDISDLEKYFINAEEFGIKEKNELEIRKTFYKKLVLLIDDLKEEKEIKEIQQRKRIYGINLKKEENKAIKDNEYWIDEKAVNKLKEQSHFLKMAKERKLRQQRNQEIIDNILIKCSQRAFNIKHS